MPIATTTPSIHKWLFGELPIEPRQPLYDAFPDFRGYSDKKRDIERFRTVFVCALHQTLVSKSRETKEVFLFIPHTHDDWATTQIRALSQEVFTWVKKTEHVQDTATFIGQCLKSLRIGHSALQFRDEPERWASFGFSQRDLIPEWMRSRLLVQ